MIHEYQLSKSVQKPRQVKMAISLLYIYAVLSILIDLTLSIINGNFSIGVLIVQAMIFSVSIYSIYMISKGKAWSRNLLLILFILGACGSLWLFPNIKSEYRYLFIISLIEYSLGLALIILLYLKPSKQWFETFKRTE